MPSERLQERSQDLSTDGEALTVVFGLLGKRWSGLIIGVLLAGPARFSEIARHVPGMSDRMLSERLTELSRARLLDREADIGAPGNVHYRLTEKGAALRPALRELARWAHEFAGYKPDCDKTPSTD
jgi:DNA-binding HxlR family transcriptional regulator